MLNYFVLLQANGELIADAAIGAIFPALIFGVVIWYVQNSRNKKNK